MRGYHAVETCLVRGVVKLLLNLALFSAYVPCSFASARGIGSTVDYGLTTGFFRRVTRNAGDENVLLAAEAVDGALDVVLGLGGLDFELAFSMLFATACLQTPHASDVADGLNNVALHFVEATGGLTARHGIRLCFGR